MKICRKYTPAHIGEWFQFKILDLITLPPEGIAYYRIEDEDLYQFMVPALPYQNYHLQLKSEWWFKLEFIDCSGAYVFEPRHPDYSEKSSAIFTVQHVKTIVNFLGLSEQVIEVFTNTNETATIRLTRGLPTTVNEIQAYVERIKLGQLLLLPVKDGSPVYKPSNKITLKINQKQQLPTFGLSFILEDDFGNLHAFPCEPYQQYDLPVGGFIECEIRRISTKGYLYLEPKHPVYSIDEIYCFEILDLIRDRKGIYGFSIDIFGHVIKIANLDSGCTKDMVVQGKIRWIEKGIPVVDFYDFC